MSFVLLASKESFAFQDGITLKWMSIGDFVEFQWDCCSLKLVLVYRIITFLVGITTVIMSPIFLPTEYMRHWQDWTAVAAVIFYILTLINTIVYFNSSDRKELEQANKPPSIIDEKELRQACLRPCTDWCEDIMCACCRTDNDGNFEDDDVILTDHVDEEAKLSMYKTPWNYRVQWLWLNVAYANLPNILAFFIFEIQMNDAFNVARILNSLVIPLMIFFEIFVTRLPARITHVLYGILYVGVFCCFIVLQMAFVGPVEAPFVGIIWRDFFAPIIISVTFALGVIPLTQLFVVLVTRLRLKIWYHMHETQVWLAHGESKESNDLSNTSAAQLAVTQKRDRSPSYATSGTMHLPGQLQGVQLVTIKYAR